MSNKKYMRLPEWCKTEEEAKKKCEQWKQAATPYLKRKYPPHITPWVASDTKEKFYLAWLAR